MRLLIFSDSNTPIPASAIRATLRAAEEQGDLEVCGLVTTRPEQFKPFTAVDRVKRRARNALVALCNRDKQPWQSSVRRIDTKVLAARGVPLIVPHERKTNSQEFLDYLEREIKPDVVLSFYFGTILKRPLLELLPQAVNLHPALLPRYRGVRTVEFARYHDEPFTGFTFHRMVEGIDAGPILVQKQVRIDPNESLPSLIDRMAVAVAVALPETLELVRSNAPGEPQQGEPSYYSLRDAHDLFVVMHPHEIAYDELRRRIWAFGRVRINIDGTLMTVTRLRPAREGARHAFRTADGSIVAPDRIAGLPLAFAPR